MSWFILAAIPPFFWALTNFVDQFLARRFFPDQSFSLLSFSTIAFGLLVIALTFIQPFVLNVEVGTAISLMALGILFYTGVVPYIFALQEEEASNAAPLFETIPFFTAILGVFFLGEHFQTKDIIAGLIVIAGGMGILWDFENKFFSKKVFIYMIIASILIGTYKVVLQQFSITDLHWVTIVYWTLCGRFLIAAFTFIMFPPIRKNVFRVLKEAPYTAIAVDLAQHVLAFLALIFTVMAMAKAPNATFVMLIGALQSIFLIGIGVFLSFILPQYFKRASYLKHTALKFVFVSFIFGGLVLLIGY